MLFLISLGLCFTFTWKIIMRSLYYLFSYASLFFSFTTVICNVICNQVSLSLLMMPVRGVLESLLCFDVWKYGSAKWSQSATTFLSGWGHFLDWLEHAHLTLFPPFESLAHSWTIFIAKLEWLLAAFLCNTLVMRTFKIIKLSDIYY